VLASGLEHAHRPDHVHLGVDVRLLDRDAHVDLRREVKARLGLHLVEDALCVRADVTLVQGRSVRNVFALPGGKVVEEVHLVAAREQAVGDVRADKARPPGHDGAHAPYGTPRCS
jgi:hypothetical protein